VLLDQLRKGDLDLVMGRMPAPDMMTSLRFEPLYRDRVIFVVSPNHPLAGQRQVAADILSRYPVLVPPEGSIIHPYVERVMLEQGMARPVAGGRDRLGQFRPGVPAFSDAIWIISRGVVAAEIASGEFVELPIDTGSTLGAVGLIYAGSRQAERCSGIFADILRRRTPQG
jgi:LysR family pca operon transcriptional activator